MACAVCNHMVQEGLAPKYNNITAAQENVNVFAITHLYYCFYLSFLSIPFLFSPLCVHAYVRACVRAYVCVVTSPGLAPTLTVLRLDANPKQHLKEKRNSAPTVPAVGTMAAE